MSYNSIAQIASSPSLMNRVAAAAADEGEHSPQEWAQKNAWVYAAQPGWAEAWDYALETATDDNNPDTGARPGVINDSMILAAVQEIRAQVSPQVSQQEAPQASPQVSAVPVEEQPEEPPT